MQLWKDIAQAFYYTVAPIAILFVAIGYWRGKRLEAAKWAFQLYEKFYEKDTFKKIRAILDSEESEQSVIDELVRNEPSKFTDYLNFFEFIAYLKRRGQISDSDVDALFSYYIGCLKERASVYNYIQDPDKGYEHLSELLAERR
jgi:hypothetical protein